MAADPLDRSAAEASKSIADLLERESISYAIGGALALAVAARRGRPTVGRDRGPIRLTAATTLVVIS